MTKIKIPSPQPLSREAGEGLKRSADDGLHTPCLCKLSDFMPPPRSLGGRGGWGVRVWQGEHSEHYPLITTESSGANGYHPQDRV